MHLGGGSSNLANVRRPRAAAASDDLCASRKPLRGFYSVGFRVAEAGPATGLGVPALAGVGIDDDGFV